MLRLDDGTVQRFSALARAERWGVSGDAFGAVLTASVARAFAEEHPSERQIDTYCRSLHLEDLALACACAHGKDEAWDHFVLNYRPVLYRAADATGDPARAREIADSLYAELFGLTLRDGERQSQFRYFHGRSSLATWLHAVFAQRYVDALRRGARLVPLPDDESRKPVAASPPSRPSTSIRYVELLRRVIASVVATLAARDRLRLRYYYAQDLTLAEIGRLFGEHEATVSRNLARSRRAIRKQVEDRLRERERLTAAEIAECFAAASEDSATLDLAELLGSEAGQDRLRKEMVQDRSE